MLVRETPLGNLEYITTISGSGGRLGDLRRLVDQTLTNPFSLYKPGNRRHLRTPFVAYFAHTSDTSVKIDIYALPNRWFRTDTANFREALGKLTTLMFQTGYAVNSMSDGRPRRRAQKGLDF